MPLLKDFDQFEGLHWETGSLRNYFAHRGVTAPHTRQPFSEAMLLGISGGCVIGYFSFSYQGYDPQARILTRNTFNPMDTIFERLGIAQNIRQTTIPAKGRAALIDSLENGVPPIVFADMFSLPYNALSTDEPMWAMMPILIYGFDEDQDAVWISDRARVPLKITTEELERARARVKKYKFRQMTPDPPDPDKLPSAVRMGIWDTIKLYTEQPPKGSKNNFGFAALKRWADLLVKPKLPRSWEKEFPSGSKLYAGLTSAYHDINIFGKAGNAERDMYADFIEEASAVLDKPSLQYAAKLFRNSAQAWNALGNSLLPEIVPPFKETRELMLAKHNSFLTQGIAALEEIHAINARLSKIKSEVAADFPLDTAGVQDLQQNLRDKILAIHDIEEQAISSLQDSIQ